MITFKLWTEIYDWLTTYDRSCASANGGVESGLAVIGQILSRQAAKTSGWTISVTDSRKSIIGRFSPSD